jgi:hypothetical protein
LLLLGDFDVSSSFHSDLHTQQTRVISRPVALELRAVRRTCTTSPHSGHWGTVAVMRPPWRHDGCQRRRSRKATHRAAWPLEVGALTLTRLTVALQTVVSETECPGDGLGQQAVAGTVGTGCRARALACRRTPWPECSPTGRTGVRDRDDNPVPFTEIRRGFEACLHRRLDGIRSRRPDRNQYREPGRRDKLPETIPTYRGIMMHPGGRGLRSLRSMTIEEEAPSLGSLVLT